MSVLASAAQSRDATARLMQDDRHLEWSLTCATIHTLQIATASPVMSLIDLQSPELSSFVPSSRIHRAIA